MLGETWINHHGANGKRADRGIIAQGTGETTRSSAGIKDGDIWGPTDVYGVNLPMRRHARRWCWARSSSGMKSTDPPLEGK